MPRDTDKIIREAIKGRRTIKSEELARKAGISRQAAHKHLAKLARQGFLRKMGSTRNSYYLPVSAKEEIAKGKLLHLSLKNQNLQEDLVFDRIEKEQPRIRELSNHTKKILRYAFSEMLNNAIEHSRSRTIDIDIYLSPVRLSFEITDRGIGIYNNLMRKYKLKDELEAIQELLKGKRTTDPKKHSGEGIFFTSKIADQFEILSSDLSLLIDNLAPDTAIKQAPAFKGTRIIFKIGRKTPKDLSELFNKYTDEEYKFSKTSVIVKLYERGVDYVSRSQARRILFGLDKFKTILLDFQKTKGIGQAFADEIFRVFKLEHPSIEIAPKNANQAVWFMIKRAGAGLQ